MSESAKDFIWIGEAGEWYSSYLDQFPQKDLEKLTVFVDVEELYSILEDAAEKGGKLSKEALKLAIQNAVGKPAQLALESRPGKRKLVEHSSSKSSLVKAASGKAIQSQAAEVFRVIDVCVALHQLFRKVQGSNVAGIAKQLGALLCNPSYVTLDALQRITDFVGDQLARNARQKASAKEIPALEEATLPARENPLQEFRLTARDIRLLDAFIQLTSQDILKMLRLANVSNQEIARALDMDPTHVGKIARGVTTPGEDISLAIRKLAIQRGIFPEYP